MNKKTIDENETKGVEKEVKQSEVITTSNSKTKERLISIDRFRGLCMFLMVCSFIFGAFTCFEPLAPLIEHGSKGFQVLPGISIADLFAPMFIFVIGLTIVKSFKSREEKFGTRRAYFQLAVRFLSLIGIGILFNGFENAWIDIFMGQQTFAGLSIQLKMLKCKKIKRIKREQNLPVLGWTFKTKLDKINYEHFCDSYIFENIKHM